MAERDELLSALDGFFNDFGELDYGFPEIKAAREVINKHTTTTERK